MNKFKKIAIMVTMAVMLAACGNDKDINGVNYGTCGAINADTCKDPKIVYEVSAGSVVWAIVLFETVVFPVYIIGWDLYQPVRAR